MNEYLKLLGLTVKDVVTGYSGVVTSVTFDLFGCVQALVSPGLDDKGATREREWFDCKRLSVIKAKPVMRQPTFAAVAGPEAKPGFRETPKP